MSIEKILGESFDNYLDSLIEEFEEINELSREKIHNYLDKSLSNFDNKRTKSMKLASKKLYNIDSAKNNVYKPTKKEKINIDDNRKELNKNIDSLNKSKMNRDSKIEKAKNVLDRMNRDANYSTGEYRRIYNLKAKTKYHEVMSRKNPENREKHIQLANDYRRQYQQLEKNRNYR
jgi:hypothetical protein